MEAHTNKLQDLSIISDEMDDDTKALQHLHITTHEEAEPVAMFERGYIDDDDEDDDDDDYDEDLEPRVTLGLLEEPQDRHVLLPQHFPSKAGGAPAWLDPVNLPSGRSSCCDFCGDPLRFVLQVYAPVKLEIAYHRTFFVFMCPSMSCLQLDQHEQGKDRAANPRRSVKVFRCQLPKNNAFYAAEEPKGCDGSQCSGAFRARLCDWCGTWKAENLCSHCRKPSYCSRKHQELHWRASHENDCCRVPGSPDASILPSAAKVFPGPAWPEYIVVHEDEPSSKLGSDIDPEEAQQTLEIGEANFSEVEGFLSSPVEDKSELMAVQGEVEPDVMMESFMDRFEADDDNTCWASFRDRISRDQSQVLRYRGEKKAKPLWAVSSGSLTKTDIPSCIYCNGLLGYEFQVMPQLLHYFHVENERDSLDWATIIVYTCRESCDRSVSYKEEFVRVQFCPPTTRTYQMYSLGSR